MKAFNEVIKDHEQKMKTDALYNLRYRLWVAMKNDLCVMAEYGDDTTKLHKELLTATPDILQAYKEIYL